MSLDTPICLYNLTLQDSANSLRSIVGNFQGKKSQEIIVATSSILKIYKVDTNEGKLILLHQERVFAIIRSIDNFKIAGSGKDYIAVTSDSGNLSILEYNGDRFVSLFNEPFSKSGLRRLSPGYQLSSDSKGRALLLTATEKNKLCYVLNRDLNNDLTISSPLEANRANILTIDTVGLDVGYENPLFAAIEIDCSENTDRYLTFYELDLGLNSVVKKRSEKISITSNLTFQVPGGNDGPSGVLVCSKNLVTYHGALDNTKIAINIPRLNGKASYIVSGVVHKMKTQFFFLLQSNHGDVFKVELPFANEPTITISYFDTLPLCSALIILKSGFLFADVQYGDKYLYQFEKLGSDEPYTSTTSEANQELTFERTELENLLLTDVQESLNPLLDSKLIRNSFLNNIYALTGHGENSSLRVLQHGVAINEVVESDLPTTANKVWTTKLTQDDEFDKYLVMSFIDTTLVLSIGETVEEITDSALLTNESTIGIQQFGLKSLIQIHSNGIRVIRDAQVVNEWFPPAGIRILTSSSNNRQLAIALSNNELVYFEVDLDNGDRLVEYQEHKEFESRILSISLGDVPEGRLRSQFLVVGCQDSTIRILSTLPDSTLESLSLQALNAPPSDILLSQMQDELFVNIGLENGVFVRTLLDARTGQLSDTRTKYLGNQPLQLNNLKYQDQNIVIAFSNATWIIYENKKNEFGIRTLLIDPLRYGTIFNSEDCVNGCVGIYKKKLKIFTIGSLEDELHTAGIIELKTTPKSLTSHENSLIISERNNVIEKLNIETNEVENTIQLESNETILSSAIVNFESKENQPYLLVSVVADYNPSKSTFSTSHIHTYDLSLNFIHKTKFSSVIHAITPFQGRALIGLENHLKVYDIGLKQLLSKASTEISTISKIIKLEAQGSRVFIGDLKESVTYAVYKPNLNEFIPFVDDVLTRHLTTFKVLDYNTVIGGDKFGNIFLLRCDEETSKIADFNSTFLLNQDSKLNGAPKKLTNPCNLFIEDVITSFNKGSFTQGGQDIVIYTGIQGTIGALIPLQTKSDIRFFNKLTKSLRSHVETLLGRSQLGYRSYYQPIKNVIDGDYIELFNKLPETTQLAIAEEVGKSPRDIIKKIYQVRSIST